MGYTTVVRLQERISPGILAQLADDYNVTADLTDTDTIAVLQRAIDDATNEINLHLLGRLDITTDAGDQSAVEPLCADIALYRLFVRRYMATEANPWLGAYLHAVGVLKDIARNRLHTAASPQHPTLGAFSTKQSTTKYFTDDELEGML